KTRQGRQGGNRQDSGHVLPTGLRVLQSPRGRWKAHSKPVVKPEAERVEKPKPEDPQVSGEPGLEVTGSPRASQDREQGWQEGWHCLGYGAATPPPEPSTPEQKPDPQTEPTVTFLFTLLSTAEPTESKDPEEDLETQECRFLDKEDWGPRRTSKEIGHLQNDCMRLWDLLSSVRADNRALGERLQNLPTLSYESLRKEAKVLEEEVKAVLEGAQAVSDGAQLFPEDVQAFPEDAQVFPEDAQALQEDAQAVQGVALFQVHGQPHRGPWQGRAHLPQPCTQQPVPVAARLPAGSPVPPVAWGSPDPQTPASALAAPQAGD
uniref:Uncharacterized LOC103679567 n=1 Tax=Ursus maritimus TaxID=29073 RepID=A0A452TR60_URSMA